jgi:hypothetical protein
VDEEKLMAQGTAESPDAVREDSAQPRSGRPKLGTGDASPAAAEDALGAAFQPTADVVAMVSRDANGDPAQTKNFHVMVDDDAPGHVKDAHWNKAGEVSGAQRYDHAKHGPVLVGFSDDELDERAKTEDRELARINFREGSKG